MPTRPKRVGVRVPESRTEKTANQILWDSHFPASLSLSVYGFSKTDTNTFPIFCILSELYRGPKTKAIADHTTSRVVFIDPFLSDAFTVIKLSRKKQALSRFARLNIDASHETDRICSLDGQWVAQVLTLTES